MLLTQSLTLSGIAIHENNIATRANYPPSVIYRTGTGDETRAGTTGLFFSLRPLDCVPEETRKDTCETVHTGVAKLAFKTDVFDFTKWEIPVPGLDNTPFDVFPGSPAIDDNGLIGFKGNYANLAGDSQTERTKQYNI